MGATTTCGSIMLGWKKGHCKLLEMREKAVLLSMRRLGACVRYMSVRSGKFLLERKSDIGDGTFSYGWTMHSLKRLRPRLYFLLIIYARLIFICRSMNGPDKYIRRR